MSLSHLLLDSQPQKLLEPGAVVDETGRPRECDNGLLGQAVQFRRELVDLVLGVVGGELEIGHHGPEVARQMRHELLATGQAHQVTFRSSN